MVLRGTGCFGWWIKQEDWRNYQTTDLIAWILFKPSLIIIDMLGSEAEYTLACVKRAVNSQHEYQLEIEYNK